MDVVTHYSPPLTQTSPVHVFSASAPRRGVEALKGEATVSDGVKRKEKGQGEGKAKARESAQGDGAHDSRRATMETKEINSLALTSTTFDRSVRISLTEPVGSMSLSPANRDVVLAARKGLFIVDLENPYDQPRFLPHLTTWVPADVQWNPHSARANWVASTSNNKLLVWNLDRPEANRVESTMNMSDVASNTGTSPSLAASLGFGITSSTGVNGTLPTPYYHHSNNMLGMTSRLSSISHVLHAHTRAITDINWSPFHPDVLASCGIDTWTWAWDLRDPNKPKQGYSTWNAAMTQVKWNRATQHRLATSCDNKVLIWDDRKGSLPLATIEAHENKIYGVDWSRDTALGMSRLVTCSLDGTVKWWDLNSMEAQQAIGHRHLITQPETTIRTDTPVWRARHLPFGQGVITLPQRGDTSLSMWSKERTEEPVHRFDGHRDIVKEYLIRTCGGADRSTDDRKFQLITWSKDQTLRLWPITDEMTKSVGHQRGSQIRIRQTRLGAPNVSYRNPPLPHSATYTSGGAHDGVDERMQHLSPHFSRVSPISSANATPGTSAGGMVPPSEMTRTLLSGSKAGSLSNHSGSMRNKAESPSASFSPLDKVISPSSFGGRNPQSQFPTDNLSIFASSASGANGANSTTGARKVRKTVSVTQLAVREGQRRKLSKGQGSLHAQSSDRDVDSLGKDMLQSSQASSNTAKEKLTSSLKNSRRGKKSDGVPSASLTGGRGVDVAQQPKKNIVMTSRAASKNFMTRGTMAQAGQLRSAGAAQRGNASGVDAIGWIAGVRMGRKERALSPVLAENGTGSKEHVRRGATKLSSALESSTMSNKSLRPLEQRLREKQRANDVVLDADEVQSSGAKDAAQVISEEIMAVSKSVGKASFEKIDVSARTCTATCYGPWAAGKNLPCFVRITFHFPTAYPSQPPRFELEHNASVPLKVRAFLLRNISAILDGRANQRPPEPGMQACLTFLLGQSGDGKDDLASKEAARLAGHKFWMPGVEEQEEDEEDEEEEAQMLSVLKIPPRCCGATFTAFGQLITFSPIGVQSFQQAQPSADTQTVDERESRPSSAAGQSSGDAQNGSGAEIVAGRLRFLQSYSALAGAMTSLARLTKEGVSVQDLDVVQLMSDQAFFTKRLQGPFSQVSSNGTRRAVSVKPALSRSKGGETDGVSGAVGFLDAHTAASIALQGRHGLGGATEMASRQSSRSRRARSASPRSVRYRPSVHNDSGLDSAARPSGDKSRLDASRTSALSLTRSQVRIWDLSTLLGLVPPPLSAAVPLGPPPLIRRRSASTPASPAAMLTPRSEYPFVPMAVPNLVERDGNESQEPSNTLPPRIIASLLERSARQHDGQAVITEIDAADEDALANWEGYRIRQDGSESESEDEIEEAGSFERAARMSTPHDDIHPLLDQGLDALIWGVPFGFIYLMLDVMVQQQYAMHPSVWEETKRMANAIPLLLFFIYFTAVYPHVHRIALQLLLFLIGTATGCGFLYTYVRSSQDVVTRRTAPLGTIWMYSIARLDLSFAVVSLAIVYGFVKQRDLDLFA